MKNTLPAGHGLPEPVLQDLVFHQSGSPSLTDAQFDALSGGVGRGDSVLVVSPTSTGKTQVALWAIVGGFARSAGAVYLVTHRALARQKFDDFRQQLLEPFLDDDETALVMATGDEVLDAGGSTRTDPLSAKLLVATYEKYLALLCGAGLPRALATTIVVCDEIQLVGDLHRGRDVEILLTLIRNAGCSQLIGLSAVLARGDAEALASWLDVRLVFQPTREKPLQYECWTDDHIVVARSDLPDSTPESVALPVGIALDPVAVLHRVLDERDAQKPVIVFCMRKADTYLLAQKCVGLRNTTTATKVSRHIPTAFEDLPETSASLLLSKSLAVGVAIHSADLTEAERGIVEQMLLEKQLDVVFATSTLAAGVNFPLGTAIFASWARWDQGLAGRRPIETGEFHNMAGRVGRMGFEHARGRVIFFATRKELSQARRYLDLDALAPLVPRIEPERFAKIALQLVSSRLCANRKEVRDVVCGTFSGVQEESRNRSGLSHWKEVLTNSVDDLVAKGLLRDLGEGGLSVTKFGKAVAQSGVLPETGAYFLWYLATYAKDHASLLPSKAVSGDVDHLALLLFTACLRSPEFRPVSGRQPTRHLPYPLDKALLVDSDEYRGAVSEQDLLSDSAPFNGARLALDWIRGESIRELESSLPDLSAGMLRDLFRDVAWTLHGLSAVSMAVADTRVRPKDRPQALRGSEASIGALTKLPRMMGRLGARLVEGLPDDVLWMSQVSKGDATYRLRRSEVLDLRSLDYSTIESLMLGSPEADAARCQAFARARPTPQAKSNWFRKACRDWKATRRQQACERQMKRAAKCPDVDLIQRFHGALGRDFEKAFEAALEAVGIAFTKLDDGATTGAPDYLVMLAESPPLVIELKSRARSKLVSYGAAVEVLAASEVHGHKDAFCVTLCHPGVDPAVPPVVADCRRLCVVESADFSDALLRYCQGHITQEELWQWLATPGQALVSDLFYSTRPRRIAAEHHE